MYIIDEKCNACGKCIPECPVNALNQGAKYAISSLCNDCGACVEACPENAVSKAEA